MKKQEENNVQQMSGGAVPGINSGMGRTPIKPWIKMQIGKKV